MLEKVAWGILLALLVGCEERERLVFSPDPDDRLGPTSRINPPSTDTTLTAGEPFVIGGRTGREFRPCCWPAPASPSTRRGCVRCEAMASWSSRSSRSR